LNSSRDTIRIDKWLWQARFFKTRALAAKTVSSGKLRLNASPISKPARPVGVADVLTFPQGDDVRVIKILALGSRRGPAPEAQTLYEDLAPISRAEPKNHLPNPKFAGKGRPGKRERRKLVLEKRRWLE